MKRLAPICKSVNLILVAVFTTIAIGLSGAAPVVAQEFRIESQIYTGSSKLPVSQNVTLFSQRLVYDFQLSDEAQPKPIETVIFDANRRLMVLLDCQRKIRLEIPEIRLLTIVDTVRQETLKETRSSFLAVSYTHLTLPTIYSV